MSDLFDHLLLASQGQVDSLAPRPISQYETTPEATGQTFEAVNLESGPPERAAAPARPAARSDAPTQPDSAQRTLEPDPGIQRRLAELQNWLGQLSAREDNRPGAARPQPPAPTRAPSPAAPSPSQSSVESEPRRPDATVPASAQITPAARPPAAEGMPDTRRASPPAALLQEITIHQSAPPPQPPSENGGRAARAAVSPGESTLPARAPRAQLPEPQGALEASQLVPRPVDTLKLPLRGQPPAAPVQPVIHVTIGRLEVRAVLPNTPATASAAQRATPVVQSLEEYLRQRSGGNER